MAWETWVQSLVESYQRLKKWYLTPPCIIRYGSRVKWGNPEKGVVPASTPWCGSNQKVVNFTSIKLIFFLWPSRKYEYNANNITLNHLTISSSHHQHRGFPNGYFLSVGYHSTIAWIHLLSMNLVCNFCFLYFVITSFTQLFSRITSLRICLHNDISSMNLSIAFWLVTSLCSSFFLMPIFCLCITS